VTFLVLALAGCASTSDVQPYGKGLYTTASSDPTNLKTTGELKMLAIREANKFCADQGKTMRGVDATEQVGKSGGSTTLVFACE
jgi:hypothetical protein